MTNPARREDRIHAGAWWAWALLLAAAASRTTNLILLGLILAVVGLVVASCRSVDPWAASFGVFVRLAVLVVMVRLVFHMVLGGADGPTTLFTLPQADLPDWAAGIALGGPVSAEGVVATLADGTRLATMLICVGAANALADPRRLLASVPGALYEVSVAIVVALTTAPHLVASVKRVRRAHELRGDPVRGWRTLPAVLVPVLEDAFARSLDLAATMDSRGYGRRGDRSPRRVATSSGLMLAGLIGLTIGAYGMLDAQAPALMRLPALTVGIGCAAVGFAAASRGSARTRYRPDTWGGTEWAMAVSAAAALAGMLVAESLGSGDLVPDVVPLTLPELPWPAAAGVLLAAAPVALARPALLSPAVSTP